jgi:hypothetical protein
MRKLCRLNIALVAAAALTAAAWSAPAAANGERPAAVTGKGANVAAPKKVRRAAVRNRMSAVTRLPVIPASRWIEPSYERMVTQFRLLIVGIQY